MNRYIYADAFLKSVKQKAYPQSGIVNESERKISLFSIMEILTSMPTADVVEVVPCKDCKWNKSTPHNPICSNDDMPKDVGFFCADGERRER